MGEVVKLTSKIVLPFRPMKQVVPKSVDHDENDGDAVYGIVVLHAQNLFNHRTIVIVAQIKLPEVMSKFSIYKVPISKVIETGLVGANLYSAISNAVMDRRNYLLC